MTAISDRPSGARTTGAQTVLVVDDQPATHQLISSSLGPGGYKVLATSGSEECLRLVRDYTGRIDLLLTAIDLPRMSGRELAQAVAVLLPGIKVIFMSARPELLWSSELPEQKVGILLKPFSPRSLAEAVANALGSERVVLLIDEEDEVRDFLGEPLRRHGFQVLEAGDWKMAAKLLNEKRVDVIVADLAAIGEDDKEIARNIRSSHRAAKIVTLTGSFPVISKNPPFVRRRGRFPAIESGALKARWVLGADATVPKPVSVDVLLETLRTLLRN
jgi:CheY-like chemotaxis protein